jgi:hypothetical protein
MNSNAPWDGCKKEIGEKIKECYRAWLEPKADLPGLSGQASKIFSGIKDGTGIPGSMKNRKSPAWNIDFLKRGTIFSFPFNPSRISISIPSMQEREILKQEGICKP